jgi:DNA polymerase-3 subunit alpha
MVLGKLESSGDAVKLHVDEIIDLSEAAAKLTKTVGILVDIEKHDVKAINRIKNIFESNNGNIPVIIYVKTNGHSKRFLIDYKVKLTQGFQTEIQNLLGDDAIAYQSL